MSILRKGGQALIGLLTLGVCKLVAVWAIARWLGAEAQGAFAVSLAVMTLGGILFGGGFEYANAYWTGKSESKLAGVITNTALLAAVVLALAPVWIWSVGLRMPVMYPTGSSRVVLGALLVAGTCVSFLVQSLQAVLVGRQDIGGIARANTALGVAWLCGALLATHISYVVVLGTWIGLQIGLIVYYLSQSGWSIIDWRPSRELARQQLGYGLRTLPGSISRAINMRAGLYSLSLYSNASVVGVYSVVLSLTESLLYLPSALGQVILGSASRHHKAAPSFVPAYLLVAGVGTVLTIASAIAGRQLLVLMFGQEYASGDIALVLMCAAMTVHAIGLLRLHHLLGLGVPEAASKAQLLTLVGILVGVMVLTPRFGVNGAALATLAAYGLFAGYLLMHGRRVQESITSSGDGTQETGSGSKG